MRNDLGDNKNAKTFLKELKKIKSEGINDENFIQYKLRVYSKIKNIQNTEMLVFYRDRPNESNEENSDIEFNNKMSSIITELSEYNDLANSTLQPLHYNITLDITLQRRCIIPLMSYEIK